jgi:hypothetical protein
MDGMDASSIRNFDVEAGMNFGNRAEMLFRARAGLGMGKRRTEHGKCCNPYGS